MQPGYASVRKPAVQPSLILFSLFLLVISSFTMTQGFAFSSVVPKTLHSSHPAMYGAFGYAVAIGSSYAAVGAYQENSGTIQVGGNVYVYNATSGAKIRTLKDPNEQYEGWFGRALAMSGDLLVAGAPGEMSGGNQIAGNAYLFNLSNGKLVQSFANPDPQSGSEFGSSVAIQGNFVVIGAPDATVSNDTYAGQAFVFSLSSGALIQTLSSPSPLSRGAFGSAVTSNGKVVLVGAPGETSDGSVEEGNAYLYGAANGTLLRTLVSPDGYYGGGEFGSSVAINGNIAVIGAPLESRYIYYQGFAYVFNVSNGSLLASLDSNNLTYSYENYGGSVAINSKYVIVGASGQTIGNVGYAGEVFVYSSKSFALVENLTSPNLAYEGKFGFSVAGYGKMLITGAPYENYQTYEESGHAYLYRSI
jgi:hypothetical protein